MRATLPHINGAVFAVPNPVVDPEFAPTCSVNFLPGLDFQGVEQHNSDDRRKFLFVGHPTHPGVYTNLATARLGGYGCLGNVSSTHYRVHDLANAVHQWCQANHTHPPVSPFLHLKGVFSCVNPSPTAYITYHAPVTSSTEKKKKRLRPKKDEINSDDDSDDCDDAQLAASARIVRPKSKRLRRLRTQEDEIDSGDDDREDAQIATSAGIVRAKKHLRRLLTEEQEDEIDSGGDDREDTCKGAAAASAAIGPSQTKPGIVCTTHANDTYEGAGAASAGICPSRIKREPEGSAGIVGANHANDTCEAAVPRRFAFVPVSGWPPAHRM